jgi:phosphate transport system permease protein
MNSPTRTAQETQALVERSLSRRYWRSGASGSTALAAVTAGMAFLVYLFVVIFSNGLGAFRQTEVRLDIFTIPAVIDPNGTRNIDDLHAADYQALVRAALKQRFPEVEGRAASRELTRLVSSSAAFDLQRRVVRNPALIGTTETQWLLAATPSTCCRRAMSMPRCPKNSGRSMIARSAG